MAKVLFVEDHEAQRDAMVQMLEMHGYEVDVACDGEEGVRKVRECHPDVILMDIRMPGRIDGCEAIRQLRNDPDTVDTPIIVITVWEGGKYRERAMKAGTVVFITV